MFWILLAFLEGVSRIWVGVHYLADIIAGALISITIAFLLFRVVPKLNTIQKLLGIYEKIKSYILPFKKDNTHG